VADIVNDAVTELALDRRFSLRGALRSEWVYGRGYQGPAARAIFDDLAGRQPLWPGMNVVEIGSGLGGDASRLAGTYGARVMGLDASADMTRESRDRAGRAGMARVSFATGDVRSHDLPAAAFDLVWTRDCLMYLSVEDKTLAWARLFDSLRPGGRVLVSDYCRGAARCSDAFETFHEESHYQLATFETCAAVVTGAGFVDVRTEDRTADLLVSLREEQARLLSEVDGFLAMFTAREHSDLLERWRRKIELVERHELTWLVMTACKPE